MAWEREGDTLSIYQYLRCGKKGRAVSLLWLQPLNRGHTGTMAAMFVLYREAVLSSEVKNVLVHYFVTWKVSLIERFKFSFSENSLWARISRLLCSWAC